MQKTHLIIAILLVASAALVGGVAYILSKQEPATVLTTTKGATTAPTRFVVRDTVDKDPVSVCVAWYMQSIFDNTAVLHPEDYATQARTCFTESFIASWPAVSEKQGIDPVLLSQDVLPSWISSIHTERMNSDTYLVTLGVGETVQTLLVRVTMQDGQTRINAVYPRQ